MRRQRNGLSKNALLDDRCSARRLCRSFGAPPEIQARKRHININFFVRLVPIFIGFVPGTNPVCPWDKSEKQGQTQEFSLFYTVEARFHRACPWDKPGLSQGQSRGRRAARRVYVKKIYVPFSLTRNCSRICPEILPEFASQTHERIPKTATAAELGVPQMGV